MPISYTYKIILSIVIFLIFISSLIIYYINLCQKHKNKDKNKNHTTTPYQTNCPKKLENDDDCKCGI